MVQEPKYTVQHHVCEALRCRAALQLEVRRPATFSSLRDAVEGTACCAVLQVASNEKGHAASRARAGALWTCAGLCG